MGKRRVLALLVAIGTASAGQAGAEEVERGRWEAMVDLTVHVGEKAQDDPPPLGVFPSLIVGGRWYVGPRLDVSARVAGSAAVATWENISGLANGFVGVGYRGASDGWPYRLGLGVTVPLDRSLPTPDCYERRDEPPGDSLVYEYAGGGQCWDRSALRRASLNRGGWDMWMWAPDWVTAVATGVIEDRVSERLAVKVEGAAGVALATTDIHDGAVAVVTQIGVEAMYDVTPHQVGVRLSNAGVHHAEQSPLITAVAPVCRWARGRWALESRLSLPVIDHRNPDDEAEYPVIHNWGLSLELAVAY